MLDKIKQGVSGLLGSEGGGDFLSSIKDKVPSHLKPDSSQLSSFKDKFKDKFKDEIKKKLGGGL